MIWIGYKSLLYIKLVHNILDLWIVREAVSPLLKGGDCYGVRNGFWFDSVYVNADNIRVPDYLYQTQIALY